MNKYKSVFISDLHIGIKYFRTDVLLKFLKENDCDNLYLVGDIIDGWSLRRSWYWVSDYNLLIQKILRKSRKGTNIFYITGNHDDFLRKFGDDLVFGNIKIMDSIIHTTANGNEYLVIHGDEFDGALKSMKFISHIGSILYDFILYINDKYNGIRKRTGRKPFSLAHFIKTKVKNIVKFMTDYEKTLSDKAKKLNVDGVICGHVHNPCHRIINNIEYWNCGSWIEDKCSAIVEHHDGRLELLFIE